MSPCACTQLHGRTCGITLVDLARKQPLLVSPKVRGFGEEQSQCVLGPTAQNVNPPDIWYEQSTSRVSQSPLYHAEAHRAHRNTLAQQVILGR